MKILVHLLFLSFLLFPLTGCGNILYVSRLGWHQSFVTFQSIPVQELLEDKQVDEETKRKTLFIQEVKRYGEERLGLRRTKSYSKFFEVKGPVLYVITACEKDRLQLHGWSFLITGRVTYKSFFTDEGALQEKRGLERKGYDTIIQRAGAYSTLGWLKDPIFSTMLKWDEPTLANIILHEMAHTTVYFKGETDFNEQLATFIGNQGAIDFVTEKYGRGSKEVAEAVHTQEDELLFGRWIDQACKRLSNFYEQPISREEKLKGREALFQLIQEEFGRVKDQFKTECFSDFKKVELNNAVLLAYRRYFHKLDKFEALYENLGRDLKKVVEFFKTVQASGSKVGTTSFFE